MALFKILKGSSSGLSSQAIREGYCYVTTDEGKMYIDISNSERICLNSGNATHAETADKATTADKLTSSYLINGVSFNGSSDIYFYGSCGTSASTVAKTVTLNNSSKFTLKPGVSVVVKFTNTNTAKNPTLNVNGTGAKPICQYGTTAAGTSTATSWRAGAAVMLTYDGVSWLRHDWQDNNSNTIPAAYCSTAADTAAKVASCSGYTLTAKTYLHLLLVNANTSASALTLNVNKQGAKTIYINGTASSTSNYTLPAGSYLTYYDGSAYYIRTDGKLPGSIEKADQFTTEKIIVLDGDVTGEASSNGKNGWSITTTVKNDSHTHSTYVSKAGDTMTGGLAINGNNGTTGWTVRRNSSDNEAVKLVVDDSNATFTYTNDERSNAFKFILSNTDTESPVNGTAVPSISTVTFTGAGNKSTVTADNFVGNGRNLTDLNASKVNTGTLGVNYGGTGLSTWTPYGIVYASSKSALSQLGIGNANEVLTSQGAGKAPVWKTLSSLVDATYVNIAGDTMTGALDNSYTSSTWINSANGKSAFNVTGTTYTGWISGNAKDGKLVISSYPSNNNMLYFGYMSNTRIAEGTNSLEKSMTWDGETGTLTTNYFVGVFKGNADTATSAESAKKLGSTDVGGTSTPIYLDDGTPKSCAKPKSGAWFNGVTSIGSDGVQEIGRYIDFHYTTGSTNDYDVRIDSAGANKNVIYLPGVTGQAVVHTNDTQMGSASQPVYVAASGLVTTAATYAGGTQITLNNTSKASSTASFYAPEAAGTAGQVLKSAGSGKAPVWANINDLVDNRFVNVTGDTMTGNLSFSGEKGTIYKIERKKANGGGWAYAPIRLVGNDDATFANIGVYGTANAMSYIYIGANTEYNSAANVRINTSGHVTAPKFIGELVGAADRLKCTVGSDSQPVYFDGGVPFEIKAVGAAYGGTGKTSLIDSSNALLNALSTGSSVPKDDDWFISQYVNGGTTTTTFHRRPVKYLYDYIKSKLSTDNIYVKKSGDTMSGGLTVNSVISATGTISSSSTVSGATGMGVTQTGGAGAGISLYGTTPSGTKPTYGMAFAKTATSGFGKHGTVQNDWATYFTMNDTANRGWIFQKGSTNVASINNDGKASFKSVGNNERYIAYPSGGTYSSSGETGYLTITLPVGFTSTMLKFKLSIYNYATGTSVDYYIGGYNYGTGSKWYHPTAICVGKKGGKLSNLTVTYGQSGNYAAIQIGANDTAWDYPNITISDITLGHTYTYSEWMKDWKINFTTTPITNITQTISNTFVAYNAHYADNATNATNATNANTATSATTAGKFTTAAKIKLTGDVTGEATSQHGWEISTSLPLRLKNYQASGNADANDITESGFHYMSTTSSGGGHRPPFADKTNDYRILATGYSNIWAQQIATNYRSNEIFFRRIEGGTWKDWVQIQTTESADARYAKKRHDSTEVTYGIGSSSKYGHVKLYTASDCDSFSSDDGAITPAAGKKAVETFGYKVKQGTSTTDSWRPVLLHYNTATYKTDLAEVTNQVYHTAKVVIQPSTGSLKFAGSLTTEGNGSIGGTLTVANNTTLSKALTVTGATSLNSTLTVGGNTILNGLVTIGKYTNQSTAVSGGIKIHDLRDVTPTPGMFGEKRANFYFDQVDGKWASILHMHGWTASGYASWELAGNSATDKNITTLKYRTGLDGSWTNWHKVLLADSSTGVLAQKLYFNSDSLAESENMEYILGITAFASGGEVQWQSARDITVGKATNADNATNATNATNANNATTATSATRLSSNARMEYGWDGLNYFNISGTAGNAAKVNDTPTKAWWHILRLNHANSSGYYTDLAIPFNDTSLYYKRISKGAVQNGGWVKVLDSLNYTSYTVKKDGTGASGTWNISIKGNAATATNATNATNANSATSATTATKLSSNAGGTTTPVYFTGGKPTACTMIKSGSWFGGLTSIGGDGVMEVGKYIDFHTSSAGTADYDVRITAATDGLTISGTTSGTFKGSLQGNATSATTATSASTATTASRLTDITLNDKASSSATQRRIWFSYDNNTTGRPAYDDRFTIQTSTGTLTAPIFSGNLNGQATSATYLTSQGANVANTRTQAAAQAVVAGGWSTNEAGYGSTYGTTLDVSGYSTWYHRLAFHTNGEIDYWQGINTNTLTKVGRLLTSANYSSHLDDRYVKKAGDSMSGTLSWGGNVSSLNLRTGHANYDGVISYQTSGNEAMLFTTKSAVTSFMFVNGEDTITNMAADRWTKVTPGLQIKNNCVAIGKLIGNDVTPSYKLEVNGTGYFSNLLTVATGNSHYGVKLGSTYVNAINEQVIFQNNGAIRFGTDSWDWNCWAGLKYVHGSNNKNGVVYLGVADGTIFNANAPQSEGTLALPGIRYLSINGKTAIDAYDSWLRINEGKAFSSGIYMGTNIVRTDGQFQIGSNGGTFYAKSDGTGYFDNDVKVKGHVFAYNYGRDGNDAPTLIFDKPSSNYTGIGSNGVSDTIYFGAVTTDTFAWKTDYQQKWRFNGEVQALGANAFRMVQGNYGVFLRNDGSDTYFLVTASGDQYGSWNNLRPFYFNNTNGNVTMSHNVYAGGVLGSGTRIYCGYDSGVTGSISCSNWFRTNGVTGLYNASYETHLMPNTVSSYAGWRISGKRGDYHGILIGDATSSMAIMSIDNSHQGLYTQSGTGWIIYNNNANGCIGLGTSDIISTSYKVTTGGSHFVNGSICTNGNINYYNGGNVKPAIRFQTGDANGAGISIGAGGYVVIGSGESAANFVTDAALSGGSEQTYITSDGSIYFHTNCQTIGNRTTTCYINTSGRLYGAAWNDYAEFRECITTFEAGQVVCENGDDTLSLATERLQPGACIVSDTFGFAIGETDIADCPIAVSGRVLAYPYEPRESYKAGDPVCAGPGGTVSKMTREEVREYPDRMIGTVSAIPKYETWGQDDVPVNGRIWIKVV